MPTVLTPVWPVPPANDAPLSEGGDQHSRAWTRYFQSVSDELGSLGGMADEITTLTTDLAAEASARAAADALLLPKAGVTDGSNAPAGQIGEVREPGPFAAAALTSNAFLSIGSIALSAGDWEVFGTIGFTVSLTNATSLQAYVSLSSTTWDVGGTYNGAGAVSGAALGNAYLAIAPRRLNVTASTTVYLVANAVFPSGTVTAGGSLFARRVR